MSASLASRLGRVEAAVRAAQQARSDAAVHALGRTMAPEHIRFVQDWMVEHLGGMDVPIALPGESPAATFRRLRPPALVRAAWLIIDEHARNGTPVSLAPGVAEVYLEDPDAYPANPCEGCGYLLPTQATVRPDGRFRHRGLYVGTCPVCGRANHAESEKAP